MSNGDILDKIDNKIERALEDDALGKSGRITLEVLALFVPYFRQGQTDHTRVSKMWDERLINVWFIRLAAGSIIGIVIGHLTGIAPITIG